MKLKPKSQPEQGKHIRAHATSGRQPGREHVAISLRYLNQDWCITRCDKDGMASFAERVKILTQKSWLELSSAGRHGQGFEKIPRNQIKTGVPGHITPDVTFFFAFRFHGKAPMVGYKEGETFHVLWFDPKFKLYDH